MPTPTRAASFDHRRLLQIIPAPGWVAVTVDDYADLAPEATTDPIPLRLEDVLCWVLQETWQSPYPNEGRPQKGQHTFQDVVPYAPHNQDGEQFLNQSDNFLGTCLRATYDEAAWQRVALDARESRRKIAAYRAARVGHVATGARVQVP